MAVNPSFQPRCKFWPIFTICSHFWRGWRWEVGARCFCFQTIMAISGKIILRWELCRQYFCFMLCLCTDIYYMWYFSHTYIWYTSKSCAYMGKFLFLVSLWNLENESCEDNGEHTVIGLQILSHNHILHFPVTANQEYFLPRLIAWCCLCQWYLKCCGQFQFWVE